MANGAHGELREYLEFAMEGRRRVKEQLKKLAAHDYAKTAFSYVERDTGHEVWVEVPEQPEELDPLAEDEAAATEPRSAGSAADDGAPHEASIAELIARGESGSRRVQADGPGQPCDEAARQGHRAHGRQVDRRLHERARRHASHRRHRPRGGLRASRRT